jgi:hypothetical protein
VWLLAGRLTNTFDFLAIWRLSLSLSTTEKLSAKRFRAPPCDHDGIFAPLSTTADHKGSTAVSRKSWALPGYCAALCPRLRFVALATEFVCRTGDSTANSGNCGRFDTFDGFAMIDIFDTRGTILLYGYRRTGSAGY